MMGGKSDVLPDVGAFCEEILFFFSLIVSAPALFVAAARTSVAWLANESELASFCPPVLYKKK